MKEINDIIKKEAPTMDELMSAFEIVKKNGDVGVIKLDGERMKCQYTLLIMFNPGKGRAMLRVDEDDLKFAMKKILKQYVGEVNNLKK